ncbi:MAG: hypothetical protein HY660_08110, partial [Armatimonadetes bacterium]|nr:hypothetical protein [Armatimonadota bacterium]
TWGLISRHGKLPAVGKADPLGPLGRTVEDVAHVLRAIAGHDPKDPTTAQARVPDYASRIRRGIKGMKAAIVRELLPGPGIDAEIEAGVRDAIKVLKTLGVSFREVSIPLVKHAGAVYVAFGEAEASVGHLPFLRRCPELYGYTARVRMATGLLIPGHIARWADRAGRAAIRRQILETLEPYDFLITPTARTPAPRIEQRESYGHRSLDDARREFGLDRAYGMPFALAGVPALSLCCGFSRAGLPLAFQIIGKPLADDVVLQVGHAYQQVTDWHTRRPPLS